MNIRKYVENALADLLKKKPIDKIKVNEITREVGTCKGTFYKYYKDKYELLIACFQGRYYEKLVANADSCEGFIRDCLAAFAKDSRMVINAFASNDVNSVRYYHESIIAAYLETETKKSGVSLNDLSKPAIRMCAANFTDITLRWLETGMRESCDELLSYMRTVTPRIVCTNARVAG